MNLALLSIAQKALQNKHTTGAAVVYALAKWGCPFLATWFPHYDAQFKSSADILEGAAVFYGFAAAGDSTRSATKEDVAGVASAAAAAIKTGDTAILTKVDVSNPPKQP